MRACSCALAGSLSRLPELEPERDREVERAWGGRWEEASGRGAELCEARTLRRDEEELLDSSVAVAGADAGAGARTGRLERELWRK